MKRNSFVRQAILQKSLQMALPMTLVLTTTKASAAALGGLTTSVGLFATLVALLAVKGWSQGWQVGVLASGTGALILVLVGAAMIWRARQRVAAAAVGVLPWGGVAGFAGGSAPASTLTSALASPRRAPIELPAGLDREALLAMARQHFVELQAAWDDGDIARLGALTTPDLLEDLCCQLPERGQGPNRTDVLTLQADLLGFEQWGPNHLASIEFSGMIREASHQGAMPFRELWMMTQPLGAESPWRLARQQALL